MGFFEGGGFAVNFRFTQALKVTENLKRSCSSFFHPLGLGKEKGNQEYLFIFPLFFLLLVQE